MDTSAEVNVIPPSCCGSAYPYTGPSLQAANQYPIATHGVCLLCLILGLSRPFQWTFIVADVKHPILGADFLGHFNLFVDVNHRYLVDSQPTAGPWHPNPGTLAQPIRQFPCLLRPPPPDQPVKYTVTHHIPVNGPPVASRPRRLPPERLKMAHQEFDWMLPLGIIRPFSSCWVSLLHMVSK